MRTIKVIAPLLALTLAGCYTLQPTGGTAPAPGTQVAFDINDMGRVALRDRIGPEVAQIEGRIISSENGEHVVAVSTIRYLRGGHEVWRGERVRVGYDHVGVIYERQFSRTRSAILGAAGVGAFAYLITRALGAFGTGDGEEDPGKEEPGNESRAPAPAPELQPDP